MPKSSAQGASFSRVADGTSHGHGHGVAHRREDFPPSGHEGAGVSGLPSNALLLSVERPVPGSVPVTPSALSSSVAVSPISVDIGGDSDLDSPRPLVSINIGDSSDEEPTALTIGNIHEIRRSAPRRQASARPASNTSSLDPAAYGHLKRIDSQGTRPLQSIAEAKAPQLGNHAYADPTKSPAPSIERTWGVVHAASVTETKFKKLAQQPAKTEQDSLTDDRRGRLTEGYKQRFGRSPPPDELEQMADHSWQGLLTTPRHDDSGRPLLIATQAEFASAGAQGTTSKSESIPDRISMESNTTAGSDNALAFHTPPQTASRRLSFDAGAPEDISSAVFSSAEPTTAVPDSPPRRRDEIKTRSNRASTTALYGSPRKLPSTEDITFSYRSTDRLMPLIESPLGGAEFDSSRLASRFSSDSSFPRLRDGEANPNADFVTAPSPQYSTIVRSAAPSPQPSDAAKAGSSREESLFARIFKGYELTIGDKHKDKERSREKEDRVRDKARDKEDKARDKAREKEDKVREKAREKEDKAREKGKAKKEKDGGELEIEAAAGDKARRMPPPLVRSRLVPLGTARGTPSNGSHLNVNSSPSGIRSPPVWTPTSSERPPAPPQVVPSGSDNRRNAHFAQAEADVDLARQLEVYLGGDDDNITRCDDWESPETFVSSIIEIDSSVFEPSFWRPIPFLDLFLISQPTLSIVQAAPSSDSSPGSDERTYIVQNHFCSPEEFLIRKEEFIAKIIAVL